MSLISEYLGLSVLFYFSVEIAQAQFYETIHSARPGQSIGASTVGKEIFQIQSGVDNFGYSDGNGDNSNGFLTNTGLRYGLTETFEVGALFEYRTESTTTSNILSRHSGLSNLLVGLRHQISSGKGIIPSVGFQFRLRLPAMGTYYDINYIAPSFIFVTSQQLSKSFTLITNLGGAWNGINAIPSGTYTINLSYTITTVFGLFVENYGSITQGNFQNRWDGGLAWLVTPNLQLDLLGGFGNNQGLHDYFMSTGLSWRTHR